MNRQNVQAAWRAIISLVGTVKEIPPNGMAIFVGKCVSENGYCL